MPCSLMEKVEELLGCSASNWVKLCGCQLQIWVLGTHWVWGWRCSVRRSKHALCPHSALQPHRVPPRIPKSLLGCRERWAPSFERWSWVIPRGRMLRACPGMGTLRGAEHPTSHWVPPCQPAVVALQKVHAVSPSAPVVGSPRVVKRGRGGW